MQKRTPIETSSLIVLLSIITILTEYISYYFFASFYIIIGVACLVTIISTHVLIEQSLTYGSCFTYSILNLFISLIVTVLSYWGNGSFPYTYILIWIAAVNWFIPAIQCFIRNMFDYGSRLEGYTSFFRNSSIVCLIAYLGLLIYAAFDANAFPWAYRTAAEGANFTPFWSVATQIEDYINKLIPISDIITYLLSRILLFLPYGYFCILILRKNSRLTRFISLLLLPLLIEILQYFIISARCDIDDAIYAFIGGLFGALLFHLINLIYRAVSGRNYLAKDTDYRYSKGSLHF